jgi:hypothetical protein
MRFRQQEVQSATVPKAAVNEQTHPCGTKDDVSAAPQIVRRTHVKSIPQARFV